LEHLEPKLLTLRKNVVRLGRISGVFFYSLAFSTVDGTIHDRNLSAQLVHCKLIT
jgi:hypothetical protein